MGPQLNWCALQVERYKLQDAQHGAGWLSVHDRTCAIRLSSSFAVRPGSVFWSRYREFEALPDQRCLAPVECLLRGDLLDGSPVPRPTGIGMTALNDFLWLSLDENEGYRVVASYIVIRKGV